MQKRKKIFKIRIGIINDYLTGLDFFSQLRTPRRRIKQGYETILNTPEICYRLRESQKHRRNSSVKFERRFEHL